jgi:uncharacterized protein YhaN
MTLIELELQNYKQFKYKKIEFKSGINILFGQNEIGKSTIVDALITLFYAEPTSNSKNLLGYITSWLVDEKPILTLVFEVNGFIYKLNKNFQTRKSSLITDSIQLDDSKKINELLAKFLGITTEDIYNSVAIFKGAEMFEVSKDQKLKELLTGLSTGTDGNALEAVKLIEKDISEIKRGLDRPTKNPGILQNLNDSINNLNSQFQNLKAQNNERINNKVELDNSFRIFNEKLAQFEILSETLEKNSELRSAREEIVKLDKEIFRVTEDIKTSEAEKQNLEQYNIKLNQQNISKEILEASQSEYSNAALVIENLIQEIKKLESQINEVETTIINVKNNNELSIAKIIKNSVLPIGFLIGAIVLFFINLYIVSAVLGVISVLSFVVIYYRTRKLIKEEQTLELTTKQEKLKSELVEKNVEIETQKEIVDKIKNNFGVKTDQELYMKFSEITELFKAAESFKVRLGEKLTQTGFATIESHIESLKSEYSNLLLLKNEIKLVKIDKNINYEISGQDYVIFQKKFESEKLDLKQAEEKYISAKSRATNLYASEVSLVTMEEELNEKVKLREYWSNKLNILESLSKYLTIAINSTTKTAASKIEYDLKSMLPLLTNYRYSDIKVDQDFNMTVFSSSKGEYFKPENNLSSGTIEQIYFLAKLSYLDLLTPSLQIPIILDDAFITFDEERTQSAFKVLNDLKSKYQIILCTCHEKYLKYSENIVAL